LAVNLAERVTTLREMPGSQAPKELEEMTVAVRAMVSKSLGALIFRNATMATQVLESDDLVDQYRDRIFEQLLEQMTQKTSLVVPSMQFILATRHLERIADHATNIAEDIIYWVRGLDVRHGRALGVIGASAPSAENTAQAPQVTEDSYGLYSDVTAQQDTQRA
jgi:phosphate transport system protein